MHRRSGKGGEGWISLNVSAFLWETFLLSVTLNCSQSLTYVYLEWKLQKVPVVPFLLPKKFS